MIKLIVAGVINGISAGICICLGGCVYLACDNKYMGAILFCVALLSICYCGFSLYTGKIGLIVNHHTKKDFIVLFSGLIGNAISTLIFGIILAGCFQSMKEKAMEMCINKLNQIMPETFIKGLMCGILMFIAVYIFSEKKSPIGILFCIPVFILSGFEHSIADMFYMSISHNFSFVAFKFVFLVVAGNSVGAIILPLLNKAKVTLEKNF